MTEILRFEGIEDLVEFDFNNPHSTHQAAMYAVDEHRAVMSVQSDDGLMASDILDKLREHRFSCEELLFIDEKTKGY